MTSPEDGSRSVEPLPFTYRVTKYDPVDRDADGAYTGAEDSVSDHGPVEAAYLDAFTTFAEDAGVDHVVLREPEVGGFINFGLEPHVEGHGLRSLFPSDLSGYHDGAPVSLDTARELVRAMLRDNGAWCRLEVDGRFTAHVGYDQYLYLGTSVSPDRAVALAEESGLFPERIDRSPWAWESDDPPARPADPAFWVEVAALVAARGPLLLRERFVGNASRWHRLTPERIDQVRTGLVPRSCVEIWPDLHRPASGASTAPPCAPAGPHHARDRGRPGSAQASAALPPPRSGCCDDRGQRCPGRVGYGRRAQPARDSGPAGRGQCPACAVDAVVRARTCAPAPLMSRRGKPFAQHSTVLPDGR